VAAAARCRMDGVAMPRRRQCAAVLDGRPGSSVIWDPEEMRGLALRNCRECWGAGVKWRRGLCGRPYPCGCALRTIFRQCLAGYRRYEANCGSYAAARLSLSIRGAKRFRCWGLPQQEYCADFCLVGRRTLSGLRYRVFRLYFLAGLPWTECVRRFRIERGNFFHEVYLVEQRMGYALRTVQPYAMHPVSEYFRGGGME